MEFVIGEGAETLFQNLARGMQKHLATSNYAQGCLKNNLVLPYRFKNKY